MSSPSYKFSPIFPSTPGMGVVRYMNNLTRQHGRDVFKHVVQELAEDLAADPWETDSSWATEGDRERR